MYPYPKRSKEVDPSRLCEEVEGGKSSDAWCLAPFLDVGFNKNKSGLAKVKMEATVGAHI
jgi:hypothetical protein